LIKISLMFRFILLSFLAIGLVYCSNGPSSGGYGSYSDNLEDIRGEENKISGRSEKFKIGDSPQINRDTVRSGKNALKLSPSFPYGMNYTIEGVGTDEFVEVSVWYSGPGQLVLVASHKDPNYFYRKSGSQINNGDEWKELKLMVSVPPSMNKKDLSFYVWNPGKEPVYADDFKIVYKEFKSYPEYDAQKGIHLLIDTMNIIRLEQKRSDAFSNGILETADDDYVSGIMYYNDTIMPVDVRLKGDWLDHLEGRKWSFRIKLKKQNTWKKVRAFSIHTPVARDFLNEYVSHEIFRENDLISPRYGFIPVTLNGTSLGIYAWEEHFDKQLVEALDRREGPILKFEESLFWQSQKVFIQDTQYFELPFLEAADIVPFKLNRTMRDTALRESFVLAHNLLNQYRFGLKKVSDIFDIEKLAGYFAMMDLTRGFHGETWHNQRFYYNPVLCQLEPIFFDAYTEAGVFNPDNNAVSGLFNFDPIKIKRFENLSWVRLFQDPIFVEEYIGWLDIISDPVWINDFLQRKNDEISSYEKLIREEFTEYTYDYGFLLENARKIRNELPVYKDMVGNNPTYAKFNPDNLTYLKYDENYDSRFPGYYVNAYLNDSTENDYSIHLDNYYTHQIEILGYGESGQIMDKALINKVVMPAYINRSCEGEELNIPKGNKFIFFKVSGFTERFSCEVKPFPSAVDYTPEQQLFSNIDLSSFPFVEIAGDQLTIKQGKHQLRNAFVVPSGYTVVFEPGCELDFLEGSLFISKSPVEMKGEIDKPIQIRSTDNSCNGFTLMQVGAKSSLDHVVFTGLNTLNIDGWRLTGAVNFYESDVDITNVTFTDNVCEDALNIIRSDFNVSSSSFSNTFADAFDSDFSRGEVEKVVFSNIGNDAIDFSGSQVEIWDCSIIQVGDKGVSAGEKSTLNVFNTSVVGANIGFASKDQSLLTLEDCSAEKANYGLLAFQKKPEYGPGSIKTIGFNAIGVDALFLVERFSRLNLNGTIVIGESLDVAKLFY